MKYVIMCCGGFPHFNVNNKVHLADWPDELQDTDFFNSVKAAKERTQALRKDKHYKYEDFEILKVCDYDAIMNQDLTGLEYIKSC